MRERYDIVAHPPAAPPPAMYSPLPYAAAPAMPPEQPEPSLLAPILRQWWIVLLFALIGFGAAIAYIKHVQPLYTAHSKIYIPPTPGSQVEVLGTLERGNYLSTQVEVIKSSTILNRVAATDGIPQLKTFAPARGNPVLFLREELTVDLERKTDLIVVSLDSPYPEEAARIVNAIVDSYNAYCQEEKDTRSNKVLQTLREKHAEERKAIEEKELAVRDFRVKNPTVSLQADPNNAAGNVALQELQMIGQELTRAQIASVEARSTYAAGHPQVQRSANRERELNLLYEQQMDKVKRLNEKGQDLLQLTSDLDRRKEFARQVAEKIQQLEMATAPKPISVEVVEPAIVPLQPSFPKTKRTMAVALVCGALLGAGLALLRDRLDGRLRSIEEIQTIIGLPILGVVPQMTGRRTAVARAMTVHLDPRSVVAEAYRTIRTAIYFGANGSRCKTVLVCSPESGDGKTTSASNLAIAIAQTGRTVLLLDADFRKPTQHKNLDIKDAVGLSSVLVGQESLDRAIQHTGVEGLDILPCGPIPANPSEILNSREFADLVDNLASRYDHILFDSPPVNLVTDARILAAICDATVMVLRADKSTRKAGEHARNALLAVGARVLGAIVNDAPRRAGYEVYGGQYYGSPEYSSQSAAPSPRRLTAATHRPNTAGKRDRSTTPENH
jgi:capsular exopolysaccharide synthesis family protein